MNICANCVHCVKTTVAHLPRERWRCRADEHRLSKVIDPLTGQEGFPVWAPGGQHRQYCEKREDALVYCISRNHDGECPMFSKAPEAPPATGAT